MPYSISWFLKTYSSTQNNKPTGCSKCSSSKAAGESKPEAYPLGYVEDFDDPRTKLEDIFSILFLDNAMFQQIMQMYDSDNSLGAVCHDERGNGKPLHHFDRFGCQLIRSDQLGTARG
jgi:hypothetical protein